MRIRRCWQGDAARRRSGEAQGAVVRLIADQEDDPVARLPRGLDRHADQCLAGALSGKFAQHCERPEEKRRCPADGDRRQANRSD